MLTTSPSFAAKGANENNYDVYVVNDLDVGVWPDDETPVTLYAPGEEHCLGDTPGGGTNYAVQMPNEGDENDCGIVALYDPIVDYESGEVVGYQTNNYVLRDDVGFKISTTKVKKQVFLTAVVLKGQDVVGPESFWHESVPIPIDPVPMPTDPNEPFTLHVHATVPVWVYDSHLDTGGNTPQEVVGWVSIGDLIYRPQPQ